MTDRSREASFQSVPDPTVVSELVREIRQKLQQSGRPGGMKPAHVHHIGLDFVRKMRTGGLSLAMEVADPLWRSGNLEEGMVGGQIVAAMGRHIGGTEFDQFEEWVGSLTNSANAESLASHIISRAVASKPSLVNKLLEWTQSANAWRRQCAILAFTPMVREGRFISDSFSVAEKLLDDDDEIVQRAVGMLFTEAARLRADRVYEYLQQNKQSCRPLILSIATQKLPNHQRSELLGT